MLQTTRLNTTLIYNFVKHYQKRFCVENLNFAADLTQSSSPSYEKTCTPHPCIGVGHHRRDVYEWQRSACTG